MRNLVIGSVSVALALALAGLVLGGATSARAGEGGPAAASAAAPKTEEAAAEKAGAEKKDPHAALTAYEGTETCLACHADAAKDVFHSMHYQWNAESVVGGQPKLGKMNTINDFCTFAPISWIGILTNDEGRVIGNGCSKCHAGLGLKPTAEESPEQLANIDCLICHADGYTRHVEKTDAGLRWVPDAMKDPAAMLAVAKSVGKPSRENCLRCHAKAGGGPNFKRGDIEPALAKAPATLDVHMSPAGEDMGCVACHESEKHRFKGYGADLPSTDRPGERVTCTGCHDAEPHGKKLLDRHTKTVACQTCHIPTFARTVPTDMKRDWRETELHEKKGKYEPKIAFAKDVVPTYRWWNGTQVFHPLDARVPEGASHLYLAQPNGSIAEAEAKIYPFKEHVGVLPMDPATRLLIPIKVGVVFKTGKVAPAVKKGYEAYYGKPLEGDWEWVEAHRLMGIHHEVVPAAEALSCKDCHGAKGRLDWKALGYEGDPKKVGARPAAKAR